MATLTIRNFDDTLKAHLRVRAAEHGRSMEEEVRCILSQVLTRPSPERGLGSHLVDRFRDIDSDLSLPDRRLPRKTVGLD
ncbi:MAG: Arc family DNA-binding protein [Wenzhouxiangella sp.]|nr:Arc family DNA-binding protein [Wenzhouxiangella sp.]